jgi:hypothetical protein
LGAVVLGAGGASGNEGDALVAIAPGARGLASLVRAACGCEAPDRIVRDRERWLTQDALAWHDHWRKRNP